MSKITSHKKKKPIHPGDVIFTIFNYAFFICFTIICVLPFYYLFINTISDNEMVKRGMVVFYPIGVNISNYIALLKVSDLWNSLMVTIARTVIGTGFMVLFSAYAGFLVTQQKMKHRTFWYRFLVITMYFGAGLIPWYMNMLMLGLTDSFWAYIIPGMVAPYNIILVKTYIESIPHDIEESAYIDGAGYFKIFTKLIFPLCKPILATITIFGAVGNWNSFQDSLILNANSPELYTLQHRLYIYLNTTSNLGAVMSTGVSASQAAGLVENALNGRVIQYTISMVTIIPILCIYPFMQRYFENGIMMGAVKG